MRCESVNRLLDKLRGTRGQVNLAALIIFTETKSNIENDREMGNPSGQREVYV